MIFREARVIIDHQQCQSYFYLPYISSNPFMSALFEPGLFPITMNICYQVWPKQSLIIYSECFGLSLASDNFACLSLCLFIYVSIDLSVFPTILHSLI